VLRKPKYPALTRASAGKVNSPNLQINNNLATLFNLSTPTTKTPLKLINVLQFICPTGFYGAEAWILALAKNLDPTRISCHLAVTKESADQNLEIFDRFQAIGLSANQIPMRGRFDPRVILKLSRLIKQEQIDIIHTHGYKSDILGLFAARIAGVKVLATPHGFENAKDLKLKLFIRLGCFALKHADIVAPLSEDLEYNIQKINIQPQKVKLIINGVDLSEIEDERAKQTNPLYSSEEKIIGYVGQMAHRKNVKALIEAFDLLFQENNKVRLLLIGDGPQKKELQAKTKTLSSSNNIHFLGYRDDRLQFVKQMDLFAMTSSLEGIPRSMMEAMAMGIPVTAFLIPGIDKLIIDRRTGLLAQFGDVEGLKINLQLILSDRQFAQKIGQAGRKHILENFSARRMADEYAALYRSMLA
jgi:glycosyltransferase involved in cell wall biosynthesis